GSATAARTYLREARDCYRRWGALAKVRQLDERHPELAPHAEATTPAMFAAAPAELDLFSVIKASQTISSEVVFDELGSALVRVMMEQGGAQRGALILQRDRQFTIESQATMNETRVQVERLRSVPIDLSLLAHENILRQVVETGTTLILNDPMP